MPRLWIDTNFNFVVSTGTPVMLTLNAFISTDVARVAQMTLQRTIVGLDLARTVHDSGEGSERIAVGIGITPQVAFAAGVASVADPLTDADFPTRGWVWRSTYRIWGFAADQPAIFTRRVDLDLRSQRKLENGESFIAGSLANIEGANSTVSVVGLVRQLWLVG